MVTTFFLIRHAEAEVFGRVLVGRTDVHLSEQGRAHAQELAERLERAPIHRIISSPRARARETAAPLAERLELAVELAAEFDEVEFGEWTGKTVEELEPDPTWQRMGQFRAGLRIPGGERHLDVQVRVIDLMLRLHERHADQGIALVGHREPIQLALAYFAGAPLELFDRFEVGHRSVTTIALGPNGPRILGLAQMNGTLPAEAGVSSSPIESAAP